MSPSARYNTLRSSLRVRLLVGTLFWIAASIIVAGWGLTNLFHRHVATQFHAELKIHLDQLTANLTLDDQGHPILSQPLSDPRLSRPYSGLYWQIDAVDNLPVAPSAAIGLLRSRSLWDQVLAAPPDLLGDGEIHRHRIAGPEARMLGMIERRVQINDAANGKPRTLRLIVAADESLMEEPVARFRTALWLALAALGAGLVIAALVQVFVGLAPLHKLRTALGKVRSGEMQKLNGEFPAEVMPLVEEFNTVLAQNAKVVERARTQAGNLAHALKTPLSVLANAANAQNGEFARLVIDQIGTARKQLDYHLTRAQAAASTHMPGARTPVPAIIEGLVRTMQRIYAERALELHVQLLADSLEFRGDAQDLQEMLGNLLDNACKWATHRVEVSADREGDQLIFTVDDDGKGLAAGQHDEVIRRGVRADEKVPGSGLGLAIVDDLAQIYGGGIELKDSPLGGLRVELRLPGTASLDR